MSNEITTNQDSSPEEEVKELSKEGKIEVYKEWVEALRSGNYIQGIEYLKQKSDGEIYYCCLGVLCEIEKERFDLQEKEGDFAFEFNETDSVLPKKVSKLLGWYKGTDKNLDTTGKIRDRQFTDLAEANDNGQIFESIADIIEEQFLKPLLETEIS